MVGRTATTFPSTHSHPPPAVHVQSQCHARATDGIQAGEVGVVTCLRLMGSQREGRWKDPKSDVTEVRANGHFRTS